MDALDLLEQQHHDLAGLFADVALADTPGRRTGLVARLVRAVEAHSRTEETIFYAAFSGQVGGSEAKLYEGYEAHALLRFAAGNLLATRATDVRFPARLKLALDLFRRHARTEEDWMFPKAKRALHDEALDRIGVELSRAHASRLSVSPLARPRLAAQRRLDRPAAAWLRTPGGGAVLDELLG
jgi:hypothetical protein